MRDTALFRIRNLRLLVCPEVEAYLVAIALKFQDMDGAVLQIKDRPLHVTEGLARQNDAIGFDRLNGITHFSSGRVPIADELSETDVAWRDFLEGAVIRIANDKRLCTSKRLVSEQYERCPWNGDIVRRTAFHSSKRLAADSQPLLRRAVNIDDAIER